MKDRLKRLLLDGRFDEVIKLPSSEVRILSSLISLTYEKDTLLSWRAIEAVGLVSAEIAKKKPELVRNTVGRLLWMIRDESGGIGWSSPEMLGEIVRNSPALFSDIAPIIVSFLDEEMLARGVLWAVSRIAEKNPELVIHEAPLIVPYLRSPDNLLRGLALLALGTLNSDEARVALEDMAGDHGEFTIYFSGDLRRMTISGLADELSAGFAHRHYPA